MKPEITKIYIAVSAAIILWFLMFSPWTAPHLNFWIMMSLSAVILSGLATWFFPGIWKTVIPGWKDIALGVTISVMLWGIFWIGDKISSMIFGFARPQVDLIYGIKDGTSLWVLSALLLFLIGPAEEIFWRGYIQKSISTHTGADKALILTTVIYTLVHLPSFNFMLIMAAFTAGAVWGILYRIYPERLPAIVISHALWDAAVFVWFPI